MGLYVETALHVHEFLTMMMRRINVVIEQENWYKYEMQAPHP